MAQTATTVAVVVATLLLTQVPAPAKIKPASLADLVRTADFIGIVRVDDVAGRIPLLRRRRASATIVQAWKGPPTGVVTFIAQPTWTCDLSDASRGEEIVAFVEGDRLALAGRGRMPIFLREGRRYAAVFSEVILPAGLATTAGPDRESTLVRGVLVDDLVAEVSKSTRKTMGRR
jgi:hypothetical protein